MAKGTRSTTEVVTEALAARGDVTVGELSEAVGLGRSSVAKALVELEAQGRASRSEGGREGGRRLPDRWSPAGDGTSARSDAASPGVDEAPAASDGDDATEAAGTSRERLGKGALGDLVRAHLAAHPGEDHGPVAVAKALGGRSSGAVGNALQRLCDSGEAVQVSDKPRRYRIAGAGGAVPVPAKSARPGRKAPARRGAKASAA